MSKVDIAQLTDWLGPEGAVAGLDKSSMTNSDLMMLARENGTVVDKKTARRQIAVEIVMAPIRRLSQDIESLLDMSKDELQRLFSDHMVSSREIMQILSDLGIAPKGKVKKLSEFAANEISDLGMYQRVAKGRHLDLRKTT
jgi:hypothetical protein